MCFGDIGTDRDGRRMLHLTEAIGIVDDTEGRLSNTRLRWWVAPDTRGRVLLGDNNRLACHWEEDKLETHNSMERQYFMKKDGELRRLKEEDAAARISCDDSYNSGRPREE